MPLYLIEWKSLDPKVSTSLFASGVLDFVKPPANADPELEEIALPTAGVTVRSSVHVIGEPRGFVLLDCSPADIHQIALAIPPGVLELQVMGVIDDPAAKKVMGSRSSEYKLK
jgi:hypothetical protein